MTQPARDAGLHASVGPGATNMVTGAALATINRLPVLLLPGDIFATRVADPVLQQLEDPTSLRRLGQRRVPAGLALLRPDQPPRAAARALLGGDARADRPGRDRRGHARAAAGRAGRGVRLAGGAVRRARLARAPRRRPSPSALAAAADAAPRRRAAADRRRRRRRSTPRRPTRCARFAEATGIPVGETQAGKGSLPYDHPQALGAIGATGTTAANALAARGRRRASASARAGATSPPPRRPSFQRPGRALRQPQRRARSTPPSTPALPLVADARAGARGAARGARRAGRADRDHARARAPARRRVGRRRSSAPTRSATARCPAQSEVLGVVNRRVRARATSSSARPARCPATCTSCGARATRRATTSSTATRAWATRSPAALGVKLAAPDREVFVHGRRRLVPDDGPGARHRRRRRASSSSSCSSRTTASPRSARCRSRSARSASARSYRYRDGDRTARRRRAAGRPRRQRREPRRRRAARDDASTSSRPALRDARAPTRTTVVHVETDPLVAAPSSEAWWDVPVAEVADARLHARRARDLRARTSRPSSSYLSTARQSGDAMTTVDAQDHPAPHRRRRDAGRVDPHRARSRTRPPATQQAAGPARRARPTSTPRSRAARAALRDLARRVASSRRARDDVRVPRAGRRAPRTSSRGSSPPSTARCSTTPRARSSAAIEVVEFACGDPAAAQGRVLRPGLHRRRRDSFRQPLGVCAGDHAVQLPGHGPDVDAPDRDRQRQHVRAQAVRARPVGVADRRAVRRGRPARRRLQRRARRQRSSTRSSSTRTSPPCRSSARRRSRVRPRARDRGRQARAGARRREEPRGRACPTPTSTSPPTTITAAALRLGRPALHGDLGRRRGRRRAERADRARCVRRRRGAQGRPRARAERPTWARSSPRRRATASSATSTAASTPARRSSSTAATLGRSTATASSSARRCSTTSRPTWPIYSDEIFGPVLAVVRVDTLDEAIELINANRYGNGTAIFTESGAGRAQLPATRSQVGHDRHQRPRSRCRWPSTRSAAGRTRFRRPARPRPRGVEFYTRKKAVTSRYFSSGQGHGSYFVEH